ncbi:16S rRNA (uracil(1498)-N(3))-methyltransferase [Pedobacter sp. SYSU D00535]|uniref:16S rRNA (uracil(1498)-N(3))-methyltransferase n=1 Tax=Pedobacter sp. SYSU D00535 TaxID=2810308 RepID=UPI001A95F2D3|nr:16S rRNA (uracil(1498)-N(3))-methyltransferase [Pedobacter sp. SYSU D00535]
MILFYTPDIAGDNYQLNEEESRHCIKVLRLDTDDEVFLVDGKGGFYKAKITSANAKKTILQVLEKQTDYGKRNYYLHIAVAPTKNIERLEWFLEKATEIGIDEVSPIICDRSERREVKTERLNRIITSAVKQSLKAYHPILNEPRRFRNFISETISSADQKFVAHCMEGEKFPLKEKTELGRRYLILIGPEGDFTREELQLAQENGFLPITLGSSRLRTETAALEACFEINYLNR